MIVRFVGGPLAQRELETTDAPRFGGWFAVGAELALYVPVHRDAVTGVVVAEVRDTGPRSR
ncbi:hypothetical protein BV881_33240 [Streptomyces sp. ZL-24]|uniref:hypothetical protein n=1 Tax=Streptomyces sp. ZL-24 TaxID=1933029 RepID=UPI000CD4202E|nr:hypothetical protein [Streptomyces sp. ZL-24]POG43192.1 hypothetical protein BV881_33240 [Streptomyces sp. ZL-24]